MSSPTSIERLDELWLVRDDLVAAIASNSRKICSNEGLSSRVVSRKKEDDMSTPIVRLARAFVLALSFVPALAAGQAAPTFTKEQLDQMVAPIALYPD